MYVCIYILCLAMYTANLTINKDTCMASSEGVTVIVVINEHAYFD